MASDWCELTLEESMDAIIDYRGKTPKKTDSGIPLITAKIIKSGRIETVNEFISEDDYDTWMRRGIPNEGDVVMTTEAPLGEIAQLDGRKIALAQRVITLRGKKDILDNTFLKYLMISEYVQHQLDGRGTGTTVKGIKQSELRKVMLKFPSFIEQKAIAHILGSLDDKIELNRQMNETLEAMAQALFKSWFVDFDPVIDNALAAGNAIPDEFSERAAQRKGIEKKENLDIQSLFPDEFEFTEEMGWIPKGWGVKKISDLVESVSITYPLKTVNEVIFLNTGDILAGKFLHKNYSDTSSLPGQAKKSIKRDDILYSEIRPKNKRYAYVNFEADDYVVSTKLMVLRSVSSVKSLFSYFFLKQESVVLDLQYMAEDRSGTFPQITFDVLSQLTLTLPNETALVDYFTDQVLVPYQNKIYKNEESSEKLAEFRDTLLPKLMSGELRIPDAVALVDDVL